MPEEMPETSWDAAVPSRGEKLNRGLQVGAASGTEGTRGRES